MQPNTQNGFTLIELLVVVAIVGILAGIAIPSYQDSLVKGRRADAKAALSELSAYMERLYTATGCYNPKASDKSCSDSNPAPTLPFTTTPKSGTANYNLTVATPNMSSFTLTATPITADSKCGVLTLDNTGIKTATYGTTAYCW